MFKIILHTKNSKLRKIENRITLNKRGNRIGEARD